MQSLIKNLERLRPGHVVPAQNLSEVDTRSHGIRMGCEGVTKRRDRLCPRLLLPTQDVGVGAAILRVVIADSTCFAQQGHSLIILFGGLPALHAAKPVQRSRVMRLKDDQRFQKRDSLTPSALGFQQARESRKRFHILRLLLKQFVISLNCLVCVSGLLQSLGPFKAGVSLGRSVHGGADCKQANNHYETKVFHAVSTSVWLL